MGNRRLGNKRLEAVLDNLIDHSTLNGVNGSPFIIRNPDRVYLEEYFIQKPGISADAHQALGNSDATNGANTTILLARAKANKNFRATGASVTSAKVIHPGTHGGIKLECTNTDGHQVIIEPHDLALGAFTATGQFGSENQVQWECAITTDSANLAVGTFWAGLKLTSTNVAETDTDQAYFVFAHDDDFATGTLTDNTKLHFVVSSGGSDYTYQLPITVAVDTTYRLGITFNSSRQPSAWVNGVQYSLTGVAAADTGSAAHGTAVVAGSVYGPALADDKNLIPVVGIMAQTTTAVNLYVHYVKCSRVIFE
tara:strand:- start:328 stop:1257 length:930 start_codon:yes stop_codon:yes gene_type:complete